MEACSTKLALAEMWGSLGWQKGEGRRKDPLENCCNQSGHEKDKKDSGLLDILKMELQISDVGDDGKSSVVVSGPST